MKTFNLKSKLTDKQRVGVENYCLHYLENREEGYTWAQALRDAGLKPNYVNKAAFLIWGKVRTQELIEAKKAELLAKSKYDIEIWKEDVINTKDRAKTAENYTAEQRAQDMLGKNLGAFEKDNLQKQQVQQTAILISNDDRLKELEHERGIIENCEQAGLAIAEE